MHRAMNTKHVVILFGGSFDPIHNGHLSVAAYAFEHLRADRLFFIPARRSPHKSAGPSADGQARSEMIRRAISGKEGFSVSDCELQRPEPSYTFDTVRQFRDQFGSDADLFWLIGADAINDLDKWYRIDELLGLCRLCIMYRGGLKRPDLQRLIPIFGATRVRQLENDVLPTPLIDASSSEIRSRIASGKPVDELLPEKVAAYIQKEGLYTEK